MKETETATQEACQEMEQEMETVILSLAAKEEELETKQKELTNVELELAQTKQECDDVQTECAALQTSLETAQTNSAIALGEVRGQLSSLQTKYRDTTSELQQKVNGLEESNSQQEAEIDSLTATLSDMKNSSTILRDQKEKLEQQLNTVTKFVSDLQLGQDSTTEASVAGDASVLSKLDVFKAHFTELKEASPIHQQQVRELEGKVEDLQMSNNTIKSKLTQSQKEAEKWQQKLAAVEASLATITLDFQNKQCEMAVLTVAKVTAEAAYTVTISQLQSSVAQLTETVAQTEAETVLLKKQLMKMEVDLTNERAYAEKQVETLTNKLKASQELLNTHAADADAQTFEAARLAAQVKLTTEKLKQSLKDKEQWLEDMNRCRMEEERAHEECEKVRHELENLKVLSRKHQNENEKLIEDAIELRRVNAKLIGHQNPKQKIQHHMKIKKENDTLKQEKANMERDVRRYRILLKKEGIMFEANKENSSAAVNKQEEEWVDDLSNKYDSLSKKQRSMDDKLMVLVEEIRGFVPEEVLKGKTAADTDNFAIVKAMVDQFSQDREELIKIRRELTIKEREFNLLEAQNKLKHESALLDQTTTAVGEDEFVDSAGFFSKR